MMLNKTVVICGGEDGAEVYKGKASWYETRAVKSETGGRRKNSKVIIRIPTAEKLNVVCGDIIYAEDDGTLQTEKHGYVITEICDNRRGAAAKHYKLIAGNE